MENGNPRIYRAKGKFLMGKKMQPFTMEAVSLKPKDVEEKVYSEIGSKHKVKRGKIVIDSIDEIQLAEATDPLVRHMAGE
jgi:large subunit ribosomal protein LX